MNARAAIRHQPEDLRFFGFSLPADTAEMMLATMAKKKLNTNEYLKRLIVADVVRDAEARG